MHTHIHALVVLIALGLGGVHASGSEYRNQPGILVYMIVDGAISKPLILHPVLGDSQMGGGGGGGFACCGVANTKGPNGFSWSYSYGFVYTVISQHPGHLAIQTHYDFSWNGKSTKVDRMLPVWENSPNESKWSRLEDHFTAFACLSEKAVRLIK